MRYTTIIDVTEMPKIWANKNIALCYFFMACKAGYHSDDRDLLSISTRKLASELGITHAAVRHALRVLMAHNLIKKVDAYKWSITKFVMPDIIPSRPKKMPKEPTENDVIHQELLQRAAEQREQMYKEAKEGKRGIMALLEYYDQQAAKGDKVAKKEAEKLRSQLQQSHQ